MERKTLRLLCIACLLTPPPTWAQVVSIQAVQGPVAPGTPLAGLGMPAGSGAGLAGGSSLLNSVSIGASIRSGLTLPFPALGRDQKPATAPLEIAAAQAPQVAPGAPVAAPIPAAAARTPLRVPALQAKPAAARAQDPAPAVRETLSAKAKDLADAGKQGAQGRMGSVLTSMFDTGRQAPAGAVDVPATAGPAPHASGLQTPQTDSPKSLVLLQIDGLSHGYLQKALDRGYAPNLATLLREGGYTLSSYLCGIPTVTMAVQAALFYGRLLPGNEWYDKKKGAEEVARRKESEFPSETGLLHGGRVYLSELSGGAVRGADVSRIFGDDKEKMGVLKAVAKELSVGLPLFVRYLLTHNPIVSVPAVLFNFARDAWRMRRHFKARGFDTAKDRKAPYFISLIANVFSHVASEGIRQSIRKKVPVAYADFSNYDEWAHYYGPEAPETFEALRRIDAQVGEIAREARKSGARLLVFSDHGQTPSENFGRKFGLSPQAMVDGLLAETGTGKPGDLVFSHVYGMGNIYVRDVQGHMDLGAFESRFPGFLEGLLGHPAVGMAAVRDGDAVALFGKEGRLMLDREGRVLAAEGKDPRLQYLDPELDGRTLAAQIRNYLELEGSGDVVVFAPYRDGATLDFNHKYSIIAEHGGIGGEQMHPFVLFDPAVLPLSPADGLDARGLNRTLRRLKP